MFACALLLLLPTALGNHYETLGVSKDADVATIRKAYRKIAQANHPDKSNGQGSVEIFNAATTAYEVLTDPDQRQIYDDFGEQKFQSEWEFRRAQGQKGKAAAQRDFYSQSEDVKALTMKNFDKLANPKVVEFYAPWCSHCQTFVSDYKRTAMLLEGEVRFGAVNCEKNVQLCQHFQIHTYPTIRMFVDDGADDYLGQHTSEALYAWVKMQLINNVVPITPQSFESLVVNTQDPWLIDFSAGAWCGPCTAAKARLRQLAVQVDRRMFVGIVDCDQYRQFCNDNQVPYYPQLRLFAPTSDVEARRAGRELSYANANQQYPSISTLDIVGMIVEALVPPSFEARAPVDSETADAEAAQAASDSADEQEANPHYDL